ncbi:MAG: hypothetical protein JSS49_03565 [Planctomycetes bacterium]|nr:hypothetical protein [Planctomycetota bacterium]
MARFHGWIVAACLAGLSTVWLTASRAGEQPAVSALEAAGAAPVDQVAQLLERIEKLEKRIAVLEEQSTRTAQAIVPAYQWTPQRLPESGRVVPPTELPPPRPRILLLKQSN